MKQRNPKAKLLLGPGPSNPDPRVLRALAELTLGYLDPDFVAIMDETAELLSTCSTLRTNSPSRCPVQVRPEWTQPRPGGAGDKAIICSVASSATGWWMWQRAGAQVVCPVNVGRAH